ncbi:MAG: UDP-N-acetylmuramoyl-L-alanyl-D-glutamate--2,6-diaminopimelate ligase [Candidatus Nanopelagicaceae bacterium]
MLVDDLVADEHLLRHEKSLIDIASYLGDTGRELSSLSDVSITEIASSTHSVTPGSLFVAQRGIRSHGANYANEAIAAGAVAILTDREGEAILSKRGLVNVPLLVVSKPEIDLGHLAHWFHGDPMRSMHAVGVTGTNGKSTITTLLYEIWTAANYTSGLMGTIATVMPGVEITSSRTTESADEIARLTAQMVQLHVRTMAMEVSSHGLALHRLAGAHFSSVAFSNLSQDHLDFHGDMESYFQAKARLFTHEFSDRAFINIDEAYGRRLAEMTGLEVMTISLKDPKASWFVERREALTSGYRLALRGPGGILIESDISLLGMHNIENYVMAVALAIDSGVDPLVIADLSKNLRGARGRMESVDLGQSFAAYVDYAHTPDAVTRVLTALRENISGRVIALLGCGGDRDSGKRPLMGRALLDGSDIAIFTSDNPRNEDPVQIIDEMTKGLDFTSPSLIEVDRRRAIRYAVSIAQPGDVVIALGKGHERGQEIAGHVEDFDDRLELAMAIEGR